MCYQSAAASGAQGREVLRHGILVLLLPSLSLFVGIFALIYKRRNVARMAPLKPRGLKKPLVRA